MVPVSADMMRWTLKGSGIMRYENGMRQEPRASWTKGDKEGLLQDENNNGRLRWP